MEASEELDVVTGAFGYTGKYITRRLLSLGKKVRTITGHPTRPNPFGNRVSAVPFNFDNQGELTRNLRGAATLYNTYWLRFSRGEVTFDTAVANTKILMEAAEEAHIRRVVHISITNASEESPFAYFRGKGILEKVISQSKLSYAIIRPTVLFGHEDILINNIAWILRHFPLFAIAGSGNYKLQPVFVEDVANIAVEAGQHGENMMIDAVGPEIYSFNEMVKLIANKIHSKAIIVHLKPKTVLFFSKLIGYIVNDVILTEEEIYGLMSNLLISKNPPTGHVRLGDWLTYNADIVGTKYASELRRHYR
ncbi:MAG: NAD-dependent epimerase/dehydratase family protein [Candidatus Jettenia sp.]|uniref:NAD-dependent epimerase/dehydratase n=1 Tax=Candidatus Jettenia caeni TaxID=247490 RepID=I3IHY6_9BACT|nr:NAD(P)H-binding protein [Candidatus Jettenia sp. AMX1]MBC6930011.1 NAD-dependent epimerase/dehydratase family protein [Candidatus Jettenia sp.]WKZ16656.1 MAG: NAD(P)H-binding protein [Candidatus Jettenia caeni]KAA0248402.1 MAG: NAD-dependent epimerase/dehydratase family protein [Candidatus Jettenia sp. AMX1]MCE7881619.1 NAD-dependent epimerase/dehydratase family protein [Candidatus Jettenia sp. AMX1]MCQ3928290.1 NAD-dependent epimerase/dehydratase family protein [Candidatus Jettenia sp.]